MNFLKYADLAFQIAGSMLAPPLVGLLLGRVLDGALKTKPFFAVLLLALGILAGLKSLYSIVMDSVKR